MKNLLFVDYRHLIFNTTFNVFVFMIKQKKSKGFLSKFWFNSLLEQKAFYSPVTYEDDDDYVD